MSETAFASRYVRCCDGSVEEWDELASTFADFHIGMAKDDGFRFTVENYNRTEEALRRFGVDEHLLYHVTAQYLCGNWPENLVGVELIVAADD